MLFALLAYMWLDDYVYRLDLGNNQKLFIQFSMATEECKFVAEPKNDSLVKSLGRCWFDVDGDEVNMRLPDLSAELTFIGTKSDDLYLINKDTLKLKVDSIGGLR